MTDIHIPPAALEAGARAIQDMRYATHLYGADDIARAAFVAMVEAWEGMSAKQSNEHVALFNSQPALILPLTEKTDDE